MPRKTATTAATAATTEATQATQVAQAPAQVAPAPQATQAAAASEKKASKVSKKGKEAATQEEAKVVEAKAGPSTQAAPVPLADDVESTKHDSSAEESDSNDSTLTKIVREELALLTTDIETIKTRSGKMKDVKHTLEDAAKELKSLTKANPSANLSKIESAISFLSEELKTMIVTPMHARQSKLEKLLKFHEKADETTRNKKAKNNDGSGFKRPLDISDTLRNFINTNCLGKEDAKLKAGDQISRVDVGNYLMKYVKDKELYAAEGVTITEGDRTFKGRQVYALDAAMCKLFGVPAGTQIGFSAWQKYLSKVLPVTQASTSASASK